MIRILQSSWFAVLAGSLIYLGVTAALIRPSQLALPRPAPTPARGELPDLPSWRFRNPEFDQWVAQIRQEKQALDARQQQLQELQLQLEARRQELESATQIVHQLQAEFDRNVIRIREQQVDNLRRQAKVLAGMSPDAAAALINEMTDDEAVRILYTMKPSEASAVIEAFSKLGKTEARRAATLTEKIRRTLPPAAGATPKTPA